MQGEGAQPRTVSHLTGGVRLTAVRREQKAHCQNYLRKVLNRPKRSFSSSIWADHPFLQLNAKQKGLVFPERTLLCRRKERAISISYLTRDFPQGGERIVPASARWLTQEGYKLTSEGLSGGEV